MKKLIVICMLVAIGAVAMIEKSNAENSAGNCSATANCDTHLPPAIARNSAGMGANSGWQNQNQPNGNNGGNWRRGYGYGGYAAPYYYDDPYAYGNDPYAYGYSYRPRKYSTSNRCSSWGQRLTGLGYRNVRAADCAGSSYVYRATKAGRPVRVTVSASSGSVIRVANAY